MILKERLWLPVEDKGYWRRCKESGGDLKDLGGNTRDYEVMTRGPRRIVHEDENIRSCTTEFEGPKHPLLPCLHRMPGCCLF